MLIGTLTVHPGGDASRAHQIGRLEIANVSQLADVSDYSVMMVEPERVRMVEVRGHRRADGAWPLVRRAIAAVMRRRG